MRVHCATFDDLQHGAEVDARTKMWLLMARRGVAVAHALAHRAISSLLCKRHRNTGPGRIPDQLISAGMCRKGGVHTSCPAIVSPGLECPWMHPAEAHAAPGCVLLHRRMGTPGRSRRRVAV